MRAWLTALPALFLFACAGNAGTKRAQHSSLEASALDSIPISYNVDAAHPLWHVAKWSYVVSDITNGGKIDRLAQGDDDMVVIDDARTESDLQSYNMARDVAKLRGTVGVVGKPKVVLAYVDVGQMETNRYYHQKGWHPGSPDWIAGRDPDGWGATAMPVAFWRDEWKEILFRGGDSVMARVVNDGFDGVYMDWVEAVSFPAVVAQAAADGVDPKAEMVKLISELRDRARRVNPDFMIVAQNATEMRNTPGYMSLLSGQAQEQIFFDGLANAKGDDPRQGDCRLPLLIDQPMPESNADHCRSLNTMRASSEEFVRNLASYLAAGVPVFAVDYALEPANARAAYQQFDKFDFIGLVTRRSLDQPTSTPAF